MAEDNLKDNLKGNLSRLNDIYALCNIIKDGLTKKEHSIYERFLGFFHQVINNNLIHLNTELAEFKLNDSDNEDIYDDSIKNMQDDDDVVSISDYETDTDDEDNIKSEELLLNYDEVCRKMFLQLREEFIFEINNN
jgi:hypothetical protein